MDNISRRNFLKKSLGTFGVYSLIVNASGLLQAAELKDAKSAPLPDTKNNTNPDFTNATSFYKNYETQILDCQVLVAGGGLAGVIAAISAARHGAKVVLIQDRSRLGGNSSSEIKMHPLGIHSMRTGFREGGIIEELKLECAKNNPQNAWEVWDYILYDKVMSEPNIKLLLDTSLFSVKMSDSEKIESILARCDQSRTIYDIRAQYFIDTTGDATLAMLSGDELMQGREPSSKFSEKNANYDTVGTKLGSSLIFSAKEHEREMPFKAPAWAKKITPDMLKFRDIPSFEYGYWWIELGGDCDAIKNHEKLRFELLSIVLGVWDYVKNSGKFPQAKNYAIETLGMLPGRRDTFRIKGQYIFTQNDIEGAWRDLPDAVACGGWSMDDHPKEGFLASSRPPCRQDHRISYYNIPLGSLISNKISNLLFAGRNASCSHVAFTSTRVMATCSSMGQAVGTCAALSLKSGKTPSQIRADKDLLEQLKQTLLKDNQALVGIKNEDPLDLARKAVASANISDLGTSPANVLNGFNIEFKGKRENRWIAEIKKNPVLRLDWQAPQTVSEIHLCLDSGCRELAMALQKAYVNRMILAAQPEVLKDFKIYGVKKDSSKELLADIKDNYMRLVKIKVPSTELLALEIHPISTNGDKFARIFEVRAYA